MSQEIFKVVLLGDTSVGKSSILQRFAKGSFKKDLEPTIGAQFQSKLIDIPQNNSQIKLQIWDTAGQEKYRSITPMYYRDAAAAICVFDITSKSTLDNVQSWVEELHQKAPSHIIIALAGNKSDLHDKEEVSMEEGREFALKHQIEIFQQTSAKEDSGINELFYKIAQRIEKNKATILQASGINPSIIEVNSESSRKKKKSSGCC